jgi:predicted deacylase
MQPLEFDLNQFSRGKMHAFDLAVSAGGNSIPVPVLLVRGSRPGKVLVATAGIHGDEYEGVQAILNVSAKINPAEMEGYFIAVPVANPTAF